MLSLQIVSTLTLSPSILAESLSRAAPGSTSADKKAKVDPSSLPVAPIITTPCVRSTASPPCPNASAVRCSFSACLACCLLLDKDNGEEGSACEFHETKRIKGKEKREAKKAGGKARKAEGKAKSRANLMERVEQGAEVQPEASL